MCSNTADTHDSGPDSGWVINGVAYCDPCNKRLGIVSHELYYATGESNKFTSLLASATPEMAKAYHHYRHRHGFHGDDGITTLEYCVKYSEYSPELWALLFKSIHVSHGLGYYNTQYAGGNVLHVLAKHINNKIHLRDCNDFCAEKAAFLPELLPIAEYLLCVMSTEAINAKFENLSPHDIAERCESEFPLVSLINEVSLIPALIAMSTTPATQPR
jgi:hypothetical protein